MKSTLAAAVVFALVPLLWPTPVTPPRADSRVAAVIDRQGDAVVRPAGAQRWTPLRQRMVLLPGDTVRTDGRGANAVELELAAGGTAVFGPGALAELVDATHLRLLSGELEVRPAATAISLSGPGNFSLDAKAPTWLRAGPNQGGTDRTEVLAAAPRWLTGYRNSSTGEWLGSLLAKVDGRDVALYLGYCKIDVTIRDQVAETTIEESFVNTTDSVLEGSFRFPLPADAAIAGFGMWIGRELVEADVVEKQRARQIYEDILRKKKDPGLLEWSGGNLFTASVYPIPPRGEKRIRIRYTQLLPREGSVLRYRHPLRSELTRQHPLRELAVHVDVEAPAVIADVSSPTHTLQVQKSARTATVAHSAQEVRPERDFELAIRLQDPPPIAGSACVRGSDGYFALVLSSPDQAAGWQREVVPDGEPLDLLVIADTSGSMDPAKRHAQRQFVGTLLQMLSPRDRFRLLTCDVSARWCSETATPADDQARAAALDFLRARESLGWTDLDAAFAKVAAVVAPTTTVVYVGDGIQTAGDADGAALAQRLQRLAGKAAFHAVATGENQDAAVMAAIAKVGNGSVRSTGSDAALAAERLLADVARPGLTGGRVRIDGVATAAVHPSELPNLPPGRQQVVFGRFRPEAGAATATVTLTGRLDGRDVTWSAPLAITADSDRSFVPRLWARSHVDELLRQGRSKQIQDEIVGLATEFGIVTPYTSLLVLESDADREQYGVKRTVHASDGEKFFATARATAQQEALRQALAKAGTQRRTLRDLARQEIRGLGDNLYAAPIAYGEQRGGYLFGGTGGGGGNTFFRTMLSGEAKPMATAAAPVEMLEKRLLDDSRLGEGLEQEQLGIDELAGNTVNDFEVDNADKDGEAGLDAGRREEAFDDGATAGKRMHYRRSAAKVRGLGWSSEWQPGDVFGFPTLPPSDPEVRGPDPDWDPAIVKLLRALDRRAVLDGYQGTLALTLDTISLHGPTGSERQRSRTTLQWAAGSWQLVQGEADVGGTIDSVIGERRIRTDLRGLGRERKATAQDHRFPALPLGDLSFTDVPTQWSTYAAAIGKRQGDVTTVVLVDERGDTTIELDVDSARAVLLEERQLRFGQLRQRTTFRDFVELAGRNFAQLSEVFDRDGQRVQVRKLAAAAVQALPATHDGLLLPAMEPELEAAREAAHAGKASFADHFALLRHCAARSRWPEATAAWQAAKQTIAAHPAMRWIDLQLAAMARNRDDVAGIARELGALHAAPATGSASSPDAARALQLFGSLGGVLGTQQQWQIATAVKLDAALTPPHLLAQWQHLLANLLAQNGAYEQATAALATLAAARPFDVELVTAHAASMASYGRRPEALANLRAALRDPAKWTPAERDQITARITDLLWDSRDLPSLRATTDAWIAGKPTDSAAYGRWLAVRLYAGDVDGADAWCDALSQQSLDPRRDEAQAAMIRAAIEFQLGSGWNFYGAGPDRDRAEHLAALLRRLCALEHGGFELANQALGNWRFTNTDAHRTLLLEFSAQLAADGAIQKLPLEPLVGMLRTQPWDVRTRPAAHWQTLRTALLQRWRDAANWRDREQIADLFFSLCDGRDAKADAIDFARERLGHAPLKARPGAVRTLFQRLLAGDFGDSVATELFTLLPQLTDPRTPVAAADAGIANDIRALADGLLAMRAKKELGPIDAVNQLPRAEGKQKRLAAQRQALAATAAAFAAAAGSNVKDALHQLLAVESLCLQARLAADGDAPALAAVADAAKALAAMLPFGETAPWPAARERCRLAASFAAIGKRAGAELADAVLATFTAGHAQAATDPAWRRAEVRLLLALDRTADLQKRLAGWLVPARLDRDWRSLLAILHAEAGKLADATAVLDRLVADAELEAEQWATLADWRLVLGDDAGRERALAGRVDAMSVDELNSAFAQLSNGMRRSGSGMPATFDPEAVRILRALLHKASRPEQYLWQVQNLYQPTKDFRILAALADGVPGHDAETAFEYLRDLQQQLAQAHEEAALSALIARSGELAAAAGAGDRLLLRWLTALAEQRAATIPGDAGQPHAAAANAAFAEIWQQAPVAELAASEAALLAALDRTTDASVQRLLLARVDALLAATSKGSRSQRLTATHATTVRWREGKHSEALDGLVAVLGDQRAGNAGRLPYDAREQLQQFARLCCSAGAYGRGETLLLEEQRQQPAGEFADEVADELARLYVACIAGQGSCSLGSGGELYRAANTALRQRIAAASRERLPALLGTLGELAKAAKKTNVAPAAGADFLAFALGELQKLLPAMPDQWADTAHAAARNVFELTGGHDAIAVLLAVTAAAPANARRTGRDPWSQFHWSLAQWRKQARNLGDLETPLRTLVLASMARELQNQGTDGREWWRRDHETCWVQLQSEFLAVANKVLAEAHDQPALQFFVAQILWDDLQQHADAVAALVALDQRGQLDDGWRWQLCGWLKDLRRWRELLPHVEKLIAAHPDVLAYRTAMARALHADGQTERAREVFTATAARLQQKLQPTELAELGSCARDVGLPQAAVGCYGEAIAMHERSHPLTKNGDRELAHFYIGLCRAHGDLGAPLPAVDAAGAAIVAGARFDDTRGEADQALAEALGRVDNLAALVTELDGRAARDGADSPVVRKAVAAAFAVRGDHQSELLQLRLASGLDGEDRNTWQRIAAALTSLERPQEACAALLSALALVPGDAALAIELGQRWQKLGAGEDAERAFTQIVEIAPEDGVGHRELAKVRDGQHRADDAAVQWRQAVRLRGFDGECWLGLARSLAAGKDVAGARATLQTVLDRQWEPRNDELKAEARRLLARLGS
jgi:hypothetical protein